MKKFLLLIFCLNSIFTIIQAQSPTNLENNLPQSTQQLQQLDSVKKENTWKNGLKPIFKYQLGINVDLARGNQNYTNFLPDLGLSVENRLVGLATNMRYNFASLNGNRLNSDLILRNIGSFLPRSRVPIQLLAGGESSKLRNLPFRRQTGVGVGFNLLKKETQKLRLGINGVYDQSRYTATIFVNDAVQNSHLRKVYGPLFQLSGQHQLQKNSVILTYDVSNFIAVNKKNDFRVNALASLVIPVFKNLNFRSSLLYSYENVILVGTKHDDLYLTFGFGIGQF